MIKYTKGRSHVLFNIFTCTGSVFVPTFFVAAPCTAISAVLHYLLPEGDMRFFGGENGVLRETQAWGGFSFLVGFLIVFRTSQAYSRFWDGCAAMYRMRAEWFDATSSVVAFTKHSKAPSDEIKRFAALLVRLLSMLHAAALAELEEGENSGSDQLFAHSYAILDPAAVDTESVESLKRCHARVELLFAWINQLIVENIGTGVLNIPPPILSRSFQELANGMVAFADAMRISKIPFPFPYAQACDCVLMMHWLLVPLVTSQWVTNTFWAAVFCFLQVFLLWALNFIAIEIEQPFGKDKNDIDGSTLQDELNEHLTMLLSRSLARTPSLQDDDTHEFSCQLDSKKFTVTRMPQSKSFNDLFDDLDKSKSSYRLNEIDSQIGSTSVCSLAQNHSRTVQRPLITSVLQVASRRASKHVGKTSPGRGSSSPTKQSVNVSSATAGKRSQAHSASEHTVVVGSCLPGDAKRLPHTSAQVDFTEIGRSRAGEENIPGRGHQREDEAYSCSSCVCFSRCSSGKSAVVAEPLSAVVEEEPSVVENHPSGLVYIANVGHVTESGTSCSSTAPHMQDCHRGSPSIDQGRSGATVAHGGHDLHLGDTKGDHSREGLREHSSPRGLHRSVIQLGEDPAQELHDPHATEQQQAPSDEHRKDPHGIEFFVF